MKPCLLNETDPGLIELAIYQQKKCWKNSFRYWIW